MTSPSLLPRRSFLALAAAVGAGVVTGCAGTSGTATPVGSSGSGSSAAPPVGQGVRGTAARMAAAPAKVTTDNLCRFGMELFRASAPGTGNAVISPYSVLVALGMAELGADGSARVAMTKVLGGDGKAIAGQLTAVDAAIAAAIANSEKRAKSSGGENEPAVLTPANSLFVQDGTTLRPAFLDAVAAGYDAALFTTDFRADPEKARAQINGWVSDKTQQLIPELLAQGIVTDQWRLALVNALYFKAQWSDELGKAGERSSFTTAAGKTVQIEQLRGLDRQLNYAEGNGWQSVSIPYVGEDLAMTILLPGAGTFAAVAGRLDGAALAAACNGESTLINLSLPGFKTDFPVDLTDPLKGLGMAPAFDVPMPGVSDGPEPLQIGKVIHQARISVDEHGTEAAAATVVGMTPGAAPGPQSKPKEFVVDRPFLYAIHDTSTRAPLFLGRVTDPTA
jgi:serpin B